MIKALFLIFEPSVAWTRVAQARRGFAFILGVYLLPMILLASAVEGWGLHRWGKWQPKFERFKQFSNSGIITFEIVQVALALLMIFVSALLLLKISQTFESRHRYLEAFKTVAYGYSPLFLAKLLDAGPTVHPATSWVLGIVLTVWVLYQGIPHVMQPDPTHAFGLYLSAMFVVVLISGMVRLLTALYLLGVVDYHHSWLTQNFPNLFQ